MKINVSSCFCVHPLIFLLIKSLYYSSEFPMGTKWALTLVKFITDEIYRHELSINLNVLQRLNKVHFSFSFFHAYGFIHFYFLHSRYIVSGKFCMKCVHGIKVIKLFFLQAWMKLNDTCILHMYVICYVHMCMCILEKNMTLQENDPRSRKWQNKANKNHSKFWKSTTKTKYSLLAVNIYIYTYR